MTDPTIPSAKRAWNPNVDDLHKYIEELEQKVASQARALSERDEQLKKARLFGDMHLALLKKTEAEES